VRAATFLPYCEVEGWPCKGLLPRHPARRATLSPKGARASIQLFSPTCHPADEGSKTEDNSLLSPKGARASIQLFSPTCTLRARAVKLKITLPSPPWGRGAGG